MKKWFSKLLILPVLVFTLSLQKPVSASEDGLVILGSSESLFMAAKTPAGGRILAVALLAGVVILAAVIISQEAPAPEKMYLLKYVGEDGTIAVPAKYIDEALEILHGEIDIWEITDDAEGRSEYTLYEIAERLGYEGQDIYELLRDTREGVDQVLRENQEDLIPGKLYSVTGSSLDIGFSRLGEKKKNLVRSYAKLRGVKVESFVKRKFKEGARATGRALFEVLTGN